MLAGEECKLLFVFFILVFICCSSTIGLECLDLRLDFGLTFFKG